MATNNKLAKAKEVTGISDFEYVLPQDVERINKIAAQGKLDTEQIKLLASTIPHFIELQKVAIQTIRETVSAASDSQKQALQLADKSLEATYRLLEQLASGIQTDEVRTQMAAHAIEIGKFGLEIAREINKENNKLWKHVFIGIGGVALGILAAWGGGAFGSNKSNSNT